MGKIKTDNLTMEIGFGLSSFMSIFTYAVCISAVLGQGLFAILGISVICALCSLKLRRGIYCPTPLFIVPLFYVCSDYFLTLIAIALGGIMFYAEKTLFPALKLKPKLKAACFIIIAIFGTILLTNDYFGIGAQATSPFYMLKAYKSLGFHPNFTGLLTGTITLFMMITYPFKFKKLNKYIPAEFISLAVPFIINLILNPDKSYTTINEAYTLEAISLPNSFTFSSLINHPSFSAFVYSLLLFLPLPIMFNIFFIIVFSDSDSYSDDLKVNAPTAFFGGIIKEREARGYTLISAFTVIALSVISVFLLPNLLSRISLHSIGALLIVSLWQQIPFKSLKRRTENG